MQIGETFHPSPKMMVLYSIYIIIIIMPLFAFGGAMLLLNVFYIKEPLFMPIFVGVYFIPVTVATLISFYWIPKYYKSLSYQMTESEVRVEGGVWWKMRHAIPYSRIMNVDTIQGPISRRMGIGAVDIYTAGYTGQGGGSGGPSIRRSEAAFMHVENFLQLRESILEIVRGRPLFGASAMKAESSPAMLDELKQIRALLEKISEK